MKNIFGSIAAKRPRSNSFNLSHEKKLSMKMGELVPIYVQDIVPGDKFKVNSEVFMRLAPMLAPVMHRVNVFTHYFFVPNRLVWNEWEDFITGGVDGDLTPTFPFLEIGNSTKTLFLSGSLGDYLGIPPTEPITAVTQNLEFSALLFRAYQMIFNDYYRDQNLQDKIEFGLGSDAHTDIIPLSTIRNRCWEKDYFTSALPWAQRGGEVNLPTEVNYKDNSTVQKVDGSDPTSGANLGMDDTTDANRLTANFERVRVENIDDIGLTVNDLRRSIKLQEWLEKNARGGSRYIEQIFSHFGVKSSDSRLQRPEYLGGGRNPIVISEVLQTSSTGVTGTPQGTMAGHGMSVGSRNKFQRRFEEHGHVVGIMSVLPRTAYQQGIERMFTKFDKLEYFWPEFGHLGEQELINQELYMDYYSALEDKDETFGYQSRYAEYKFKQSSVHGDFRGNLDFWHMGRIFDSKPNLNASFVESSPTERVFAVEDPDTQKLYVQIYNNVRAIRSMPYFGTPML